MILQQLLMKISMRFTGTNLPAMPILKEVVGFYL